MQDKSRNQENRFKKLGTDVVHLTAKESQAPEKTNIKESYNKIERPHASNRERGRGAHTESNTGEREDDRFRAYWTTGMSVLAVQTTVPGETVFFPALFWTNGYIFQQTNKRKEVTDSTQRDTTHAGTQQHRRMRRTTDSEHIRPPECQSSLSRRQFRVEQF